MKRWCPLVIVVLSFVLMNFSNAQHLTSARLYLKLKEYAQAEASAIKAVTKDDQDEEAWFVLGQVRYELKKFPEMIEAFNKANALKPKYKEDIDRYKMKVWIDSHNAGIKYYNKGRDSAVYYDTAIDSLKVAMAAMPDSAISYYVCALSYYGKKDVVGATKTLRLCIEKDPKRIDAIRLLGQLHSQMAREKKEAKDDAGAMEDYKLAAEAFEKLYAAEPTNSENIIGLIDIYERAGMNDKSLNLTSNCVQTTPNNRVCRFAYGVYLLKKDQYAQSIEQFKAVIDLEPENVDEMHKDATYNLGVAHLNWGVAMKEEIEKKAEEARKAAKNVKGKKQSVKEVEDLSYKEKFKAAVPYLEKTAGFRKDDAGIYLQLGKLYANIGMSKEAKAAYDTADKLSKSGK
jgi:tetratricopeptide (TPR) repeat protein